MFYVSVISLLVITFNVFYQVDCEAKASSKTHSSFLYLCPLLDDGRMKDRNMS